MNQKVMKYGHTKNLISYITVIFIKDSCAGKHLGNGAAVERRHGSSSPRKSHTLQGNSPKPTGEPYSSLETMNQIELDQL